MKDPSEDSSSIVFFCYERIMGRAGMEEALKKAENPPPQRLTGITEEE